MPSCQQTHQVGWVENFSSMKPPLLNEETPSLCQKITLIVGHRHFRMQIVLGGFGSQMPAAIISLKTRAKKTHLVNEAGAKVSPPSNICQRRWAKLVSPLVKTNESVNREKGNAYDLFTSVIPMLLMSRHCYDSMSFLAIDPWANICTHIHTLETIMKEGKHENSFGENCRVSSNYPTLAYPNQTRSSSEKNGTHAQP